MFMVLSSWQSHCESSYPVHLMNVERRQAAVVDPQTKPDDLGYESACTGFIVYTHHRHLLLLVNPKADTHFTVQRRLEG